MRASGSQHPDVPAFNTDVHPRRGLQFLWTGGALKTDSNLNAGTCIPPRLAGLSASALPFGCVIDALTGP